MSAIILAVQTIARIAHLQSQKGSIIYEHLHLWGKQPRYRQQLFRAGEALGRAMVQKGFGLVFGGGAQGLMGAAVRGVIAAGGYSLGIAPRFFDKPGILQKDCSEFLYPETMRERKQLMEERADAFIVLPGGIGTFEEFFEILTLKQLGRINKPIMLFNLNGYYGPLLRLLDETIAQGFMKPACRRLYAAFDDIETMLTAIQKELAEPLDLTGLKNI